MESLITGICQIVAERLREEGNLPLGVPEEAKKMLKCLEPIKIVMASAEKKEFMEDEALKPWIRELKEVAYDIEDVLEDWSNFQLQGGESGTSQRGNKPHKEENQVCFSCIPTPSFCIKQVKDRQQIARAIVEINKRLDDIADTKKKFDFEKNYVSRKDIVEPESTSTPFDDIVLDVPSQEEAKSRLIQKLVHDDFSSIDVSPNHIPIVSIVGMGGIGKTTLAQMVYNDQTVQNHFSSKRIFWVCVSDNSTELKVAKAIAVALRLKDEDIPDHLTTVLTNIVDYIKDRTFLLVLDDVWENSVKKWDAILTCLGKGDAKQSRILLTTRSSDHAKMMQAVFTLDVAALSEDDSWLLFSHYAFSRMAEEDRMRVEGIAKELVRKCKGLPLALQVLGKFMRTKKVTRQVWQDVLSSKIWETKFEEDVFPSLLLSYLDLPSQVKRCFAFCSIFPKDTVMKKNELVRLWMAHGYLQENTTDNMEFNGEQYFKCLVTRSFFRASKQWDVEEPGDAYVTMHDLVHDFAQYLSYGEIVIVDPSTDMHIVKKPRHLAFSGEIGESICYLYPNIDLSKLRTLRLSKHSAHILEELYSTKSNIKALETRHMSYSLEQFYDYGLQDLRKLVHLRYLSLSLSHITFLPEGICDLRHLQTLDLKGCYRLESLPKDIERLTCLRHLLFSDLANLPKGLGKLSSLQTLSYFPCSSVDSKDCSSLEDLRDLNNLRGQLWLRNLNKVAQAGEATRAQLHMKKNIQQLKLEFGEGNPIIQSDVLDTLEPAKENNIELLQIREHKGQRCPGWIGKLRNLKNVELEDVGMEVLPAGLGMLRHLETLYIKGANGVKYVGEEFLGTSQENIAIFPKLTVLVFEGMSQWEHWEGSKEIRTVMPCLRHLRATECKALQTLPGFLEHVHLESLILDSPHLSQQLELVEDDDHQSKLRMGNAHLPQTLKLIQVSSRPWNLLGGRLPETALEVGQQEYLNLSLLEIDLRRRLPGWISELTWLKYVTLRHIEDERLPPFGLMRSLEELEIEDAEKVKYVGNEFLGVHDFNYCFSVFPKLKKLTFSLMPAWEDWEGPAYRTNNNNLIIMPCLWRLEIQLCGTLRSLPQFFKGVRLKELYVGGGFMPKIGNTTREDEPTGKMVKASLAVLQSLERLDLRSCGDVRRLGKEVLRMSSLKELHLVSMSCLEEWEDPPAIPLEDESRESQHDISSYSTIRSNLRILSIESCPKLKAVPSFLRSTPLEKLTIVDCPALETWWANEAGEDWRCWASGIRQTMFRGHEQAKEWWGDYDAKTIKIQERMRKEMFGSDADFDMDIPEVTFISNVDHLYVEYPSAYPSAVTMPSPYTMLEIFSVSFHWKDGSQARYDIYGNIFFEDMDCYFQRAMQISPSDSIIVSNGESLPLCGGITRSLCCEQGCYISMCLKGQSSNIGTADSRILIRDRKVLHYVNDDNVQWDTPKEAFIYGVDESFCARVHYSVCDMAFLVEVEVKLIALEKDLGHPLCIDGKLSVHWRMLEEGNEELEYYKIVLFDTKWTSLLDASSSSMYVEPGKPIPLWRSKLLAPFQKTLVFGAEFETNAGDKFSEQVEIFVDCRHKISDYLDSSRHRMQVDVTSLLVS